MKFGALSITLLAASLAIGLAAATLTRAADQPTTSAPKADTGVAKPEKIAAPKTVKLDGPLGKLDLTDTQKADIIKLRTDLKLEVKKVQDAEKAKEVALLTPDQQTQLTALEDAAAKAAAEKKAAAATQKSTKDTSPAAPKDTAKTPKPVSGDPRLP